MKVFLLVLVVIVAAYVLYEALRITFVLRNVRAVAEVPHRYERIRPDASVSLLVVGDSTGEGVGAARPEESIAGLLAQHLGATYVENRAVSGARVSDLREHVSAASLPSYTVILVQIGGNDIINFHSSTRAAEELVPILKTLSEKTNSLYLMSAGNVGAATAFPYILRPIYHALTREYHSAFQTVADREGAVYVNLYAHPSVDPFVKDPEHYLADGLHPSSDGYALWFEKLKSKLSE